MKRRFFKFIEHTGNNIYIDVDSITAISQVNKKDEQSAVFCEGIQSPFIIKLSQQELITKLTIMGAIEELKLIGGK